MDTDDRHITSYLVGDLPEREQEDLERQYFGDPAVVDRVIQVETQLLDAYARGQLAGDMRERVARRYLTHPVRRERLKFAEALAATLDDFDPALLPRERPTPTGWHDRFPWWDGPGRAVRLSMAVAVLILSVTAGWLFVERIRLREALNRVQEAHATQEQRERELEQQLTTERRNAEAAIAERDRLRAQEAKASEAAGPLRSTPVVSLLFAIGGVRAPADLQQTLKIPPGTEQVRFQLNLSESGYLAYGISLQAVGGQEIISRQGLRPDKTESGWLLVLTAPARRFAPGDYMLTLTGVTSGGDRDEVSKSIFRVEQ